MGLCTHTPTRVFSLLCLSAVVYAKGGEGRGRKGAGGTVNHSVSPVVSSSAVEAAPGVLHRVLFIRRLR